MLFASWEVCTVKTCDRGLENVRPRAAFFFSHYKADIKLFDHKVLRK